MMIHNSEHDREVKASQSNYVKFRFEVITTCCAAIFGTLFFGASWWFSGIGQWVVEGAFFGGLVCGLCAVAFHALVHGLTEMAEERRNERLKNERRNKRD